MEDLTVCRLGTAHALPVQSRCPGPGPLALGAQNLLFVSLPPVLHVKGDAGTTVRWLEANLQFVASEMVSGCKGWLRALVDPQIGRALSLIREKPEDDWTIESLALKVGVSRSAFAAAPRGAVADVPDAPADAEGEPPARDESRRRRRGREARRL